MATLWTNQDGLVVRFGTKSAAEENNVPGTYRSGGNVNTTKFRLRGIDLTDAPAFDERAPLLPARIHVVGGRITVMDEAFAGATAVLELGLYSTAGAALGADVDLDSLAVTVLDTAGGDDDVTFDGASIGTTVTSAGGIKIGWSYETAAFTAGIAEVTVDWIDLTV